MVGLCLAHQLLERDITSNIIILDKEESLGLHSSGRNSGVLHAGLYYKPESVKAQVCVSGARRLRKWVEERGLPINPCGKLILPTRKDLDSQLDVLAERGKANGAVVEYFGKSQLEKKAPQARSATNRALWSPNTPVVTPITVVKRLQHELKQRGVSFIMSTTKWTVEPEYQKVILDSGEKFHTVICLILLDFRQIVLLAILELDLTIQSYLLRVYTGS